MFNQVTLLGRLGNDPELRSTTSGKQVASFSLAIDKGKDKTLWVRVTCWEQLADLAARYLAKGRKVLVVGELEQSRAYTGKDGTERASNEVTARVLKFVDSRQDHEAGMNVDVDMAQESSIPF